MQAISNHFAIVSIKSSQYLDEEQQFLSNSDSTGCRPIMAVAAFTYSLNRNSRMFLEVTDAIKFTQGNTPH